MTLIRAAAAPFPDPPYARDELLHEIFAASAAAAPDACALRLADPDAGSGRRSSLTYGELALRATQLAHFLRARGVGRGSRVVLCLPRGLDQIVAVVGVLMAGGAYVPVDWGFPAERIDTIAADSDAVLIVTNAERAGDFAHAHVVALDDRLGEIATAETWPLTRASTGTTPDDLAYIIYTSGSTGRPKGVAISHRNIAHLVRSEAAILGLSSTDRVFQGFSLAFDMSLEETWPAFLAKADTDRVERGARPQRPRGRRRDRARRRHRLALRPVAARRRYRAPAGAAADQPRRRGVPRPASRAAGSAPACAC